MRRNFTTLVSAGLVLLVLLAGAIPTTAIAADQAAESTVRTDDFAVANNIPIESPAHESLGPVPGGLDGDVIDPLDHEGLLEPIKDSENFLKDLIDLGGQISTPLGLILAYSRYDDTDPLSNDRRARIHQVIKRSPGIHLAEIGQKTGIPRSTVRYHVRILSEENLVSSVKLHGRKRLVPAGTDRPKLHAALNNDIRASILFSLDRLGDASVTEVAREIDRSPATASYHLERLADDDLISKERRGNAVVSTLSESSEEWLSSSASVDSSTASETGSLTSTARLP